MSDFKIRKTVNLHFKYFYLDVWKFEICMIIMLLISNNEIIKTCVYKNEHEFQFTYFSLKLFLGELENQFSCLKVS